MVMGYGLWLWLLPVENGETLNHVTRAGEREGRTKKQTGRQLLILFTLLLFLFFSFSSRFICFSRNSKKGSTSRWNNGKGKGSRATKHGICKDTRRIYCLFAFCAHLFLFLHWLASFFSSLSPSVASSTLPCSGVFLPLFFDYFPLTGLDLAYDDDICPPALSRPSMRKVGGLKERIPSTPCHRGSCRGRQTDRQTRKRGRLGREGGEGKGGWIAPNLKGTALVPAAGQWSIRARPAAKVPTYLVSPSLLLLLPPPPALGLLLFLYEFCV
ncbi:uncharacterized protein B0T15DRAFT_530427, partial [Chaetomium strumarium]